MYFNIRFKNVDNDLQIEMVQTLNELFKHADAWNLLAFNSPQRNPMLSYAWISACFKTMIKKGQSWFCLFAFDKKELVGVLPLLVKESRLLLKKYVQLRTPYYPHTRTVDFLFDEKYGQRVIQSFTIYLNTLRPKVISLKISYIAFKSPTFDILKKGIYGMHSSYYPCGYVSLIPVEGSFDDFKRRLSKNSIRKLSRSNKSLKKLGNISFTVINDRKNALENLLSFADIEGSGWKGKKGTSIRKHSWRFFEELTRNMSKMEWLEWYFLEIENKRIAGYMTIPFGRSSFIFKIGYDEAYSSFSPGSVLTEKMIEHLFSKGEIDVINFLSDSDWHLSWNVDRKPYHNMVISFNNLFSFFSTRIPYAIYSRFAVIRKLRKDLSRFI